MRRHWLARALKFALLAALLLAVASFVVMSLWNWVLPPATGWREIGYWQAMGLLVLARILFGGLHGHAGRHWHWRHRMRERMAQMTPEEREKFRQAMFGRCGPWGRPDEEPKASP